MSKDEIISLVKKEYVEQAERKVRDSVMTRLNHGRMPKKSEYSKFVSKDKFKSMYEDGLKADSLYNAIKSNNISDNEDFQKLVDIKELEIAAFEEKEKEKERKEELKKSVEDILTNEEISAIDKAWIVSKVIAAIESYFVKNKLYILNYDAYGVQRKEEFSISNVQAYLKKASAFLSYESIGSVLPEARLVHEYIYKSVLREHKEVKELIKEKGDDAIIREVVRNKTKKLAKQLHDEARKEFTEKKILELLGRNVNYEEAVSEYKKIHGGLVKSMPREYKYLYPLAREFERKFILHVGPTNSGKTYQAMEALKKADNGIYLGPLRLLAYEQYEKLNSCGCPCDLVTGEESIHVENHRYTASTIEMMPTDEYFEVAVIDECQMIADRARGGSWTSAILGVLAQEIHCCLAPEALDIVISLIGECGDTYEIIEHERQTPLIFESSETFSFPNGVRPHDALIVFSRKNVHAVAADLQHAGYKCSVIYGALPYDVRHEEARKFAEGETDVVVATDAIGMGLNLPIERIVFLESEKFDGVNKRELTASEVKQIAGRAGRYGIYNTGYCNALYDKKELRKAFDKDVPEIRKAIIGFPESLIGIDAKLSSILKQWDSMDVNKRYQKANLDEMIFLCDIAEKYTQNKDLLYKLITIPFDYEKQELLDVWKMMVEYESVDYHFSYDLNEINIPDIESVNASNMEELEINYRLLDLLYYYDTRFNYGKQGEDILWVKSKISKLIIKILDMQSLNPRRCRSCGRPLRWNYEYGICQRCFKKHY